MNGTRIKAFFDERYPAETAYEWDNVGLQIGTLNKEISGILIALDLTKDVLKEALTKDANLIITHHPFIFQPLSAILTDTYKGRLIKECLKQDVALFVAHTNYDVGETGMNKVLADMIGLKDQTVLEQVSETHGIGRIGRIAETPLESFVETVKNALGLAAVRVIARDTVKPIKTVAISGGSGASHMGAAKMKGADLYVTGDIRYHDALEMMQIGLAGLDIGHYAERHFAASLKRELLDAGISSSLHVSEKTRDPFIFT